MSPIWKGWGCSWGIFVLTPKRRWKRHGSSFFQPLRGTKNGSVRTWKCAFCNKGFLLLQKTISLTQEPLSGAVSKLKCYCLMFSTLSGTRTWILTPKRYDEHPQPFHVEVPLPSPPSPPPPFPPSPLPPGTLFLLPEGDAWVFVWGGCSLQILPVIAGDCVRKYFQCLHLSCCNYHAVLLHLIFETLGKLMSKWCPKNRFKIYPHTLFLPNTLLCHNFVFLLSKMPGLFLYQAKFCCERGKCPKQNTSSRSKNSNR